MLVPFTLTILKNKCWLDTKTAFNAHCAFYSSPHLYIVGGRQGGVARAEVYRRHLGQQGAWQGAASMPGPRAAAGCVHDPAQDR